MTTPARHGQAVVGRRHGTRIASQVVSMRGADGGMLRVKALQTPDLEVP
jgi:hypothetical protein